MSTTTGKQRKSTKPLMRKDLFHEKKGNSLKIGEITIKKISRQVDEIGMRGLRRKRA